VSGPCEPARWQKAHAGAAYELYPPLQQRGLLHGLIVRQPGVEVSLDRAETLKALRPSHERILSVALPAGQTPHTAEQVHGSEVALAEEAAGRSHAGADALISAQPGAALGIYVADCCAVFLWDSERRAVGLVHSGAKGTASGIVPRALERMGQVFGCVPRRMVAVLSPCIRPPLYETDFAAEVRRQCVDAGVGAVWDGGECTGSDLDRFYSYRMERGRTGRMLAFVAL
jgi:copper oxidase (laccase) domain-containing protein